MNSLIFLDTYEFFQIFRTIQGYNHEALNSTIRKILECDMEPCYKNISEIFSVLFILNISHTYMYDCFACKK